jgi:hypothetical protein
MGPILRAAQTTARATSFLLIVIVGLDPAIHPAGAAMLS